MLVYYLIKLLMFISRYYKGALPRSGEFIRSKNDWTRYYKVSYQIKVASGSSLIIPS